MEQDPRVKPEGDESKNSQSDPVIRVEHLIFEYPGTRALDDVTFEIAPRTITALIGPNGAGKTTLLRCIAALDTPFAGSVTVAGLNVEDEPRECHRRLGFLGDFYGLYDELSVRRCLAHKAAAHAVPRGDIEASVARAAERVQIADLIDRKAGALSRGQRQRLAIAQAIVHKPEVLLLDEPASGLDPEARWSLSSLLTALRDDGMMLVVSSHILAELEDYSTDVLILRDGKVVEHRALAGTGSGAGTVAIRIELVERDTKALARALESFDGVVEAAIHGLSATVTLRGDRGAQHRLLRHLIEAGLAVSAFAEDRSRVEDVYLARMRGEAPAPEAAK
jgi:ABC-2 type transport system ATP-binding protein